MIFMDTIPPQLVILAIIAKSREGLTLKEIASYIEYLYRRGIDVNHYISSKKGYANGISKDIILDVNTLKILNLVKEVNGKYVVSDKGYAVLKKIAEGNNIIKMIVNL